MCIPIIFGCPTNIKPEGEQALRMCPRCHNQTVISAKSSTWFELFWVPLIPFSRKHILICSTCQWSQVVPKGAQTCTGATQMIPPNQAGSQSAYTATSMPKV